jgi:hypothetical protein
MARELFTPTDEQRGMVKAFAAYGVQQDEIAKYLEIDPKTLRKHFRRELDTGSIEATSKVAQSLYKAATSGNVGAAIFWMKARGGWREKHEIDVTSQGQRLGYVIMAPAEAEDADAWAKQYQPPQT